MSQATPSESDRSDLDHTDLSHTLPLLPLTSGVVLPGMVITMALETDEARAAAEAATTADGRLLLVPRVDGRYANVGTVSVIEESGKLPGGTLGLVVRGERRARIGAGVPGTGAADAGTGRQGRH